MSITRFVAKLAPRINALYAPPMGRQATPVKDAAVAIYEKVNMLGCRRVALGGAALAAALAPKHAHAAGAEEASETTLPPLPETVVPLLPVDDAAVATGRWLRGLSALTDADYGDFLSSKGTKNRTWEEHFKASRVRMTEAQQGNLDGTLLTALAKAFFYDDVLAAREKLIGIFGAEPTLFQGFPEELRNLHAHVAAVLTDLPMPEVTAFAVLCNVVSGEQARTIGYVGQYLKAFLEAHPTFENPRPSFSSLCQANSVAQPQFRDVVDQQSPEDALVALSQKFEFGDVRECLKLFRRAPDSPFAKDIEVYCGILDGHPEKSVKATHDLIRARQILQTLQNNSFRFYLQTTTDAAVKRAKEIETILKQIDECSGSDKKIAKVTAYAYSLSL